MIKEISEDIIQQLDPLQSLESLEDLTISKTMPTIQSY